MSNILSGLESLGLNKLTGVDVFEKDHEESKEKGGSTAPALPKESDFIFEKTYQCPVCDREFRSKTIKVGKVKLLNADTDLRPVYQYVDSLKYDVVACSVCGYAALSRFFPFLSAAQISLIKEHISASFRGLGDDGDVWSYDDAITRHQLALANAVVKKAKMSERAYICLKIAWLIRGKAENLPTDAADRAEQVESLASAELEYIENAYKGFNDAFGKELFPMCGMDEHTITYITADLARRLGKKEEALRNLSRILTVRDAPERVKAKARELKDMIMER